MKTYEIKKCGPDTTCGVFLCGHILREVEDIWVFRRKNVGLMPLEWEYEGWDIVASSTKPVKTAEQCAKDMTVFRRKNVGLIPLEWEYEGWDIIASSTKQKESIKHIEPTDQDVEDYLCGYLQDTLN